MTTKNLLVELFVEELPPKALKKLGEAFAAGIRKGLADRNFLVEEPTVSAFASPRRLAVHVTAVMDVSAPREIPAQTLMPVSVGLDASGNPTAPLIKKLRAHYNETVRIDWLMKERILIVDEGGKRVLKLAPELAAGSKLSVGLEGALQEAIESLPIPKVMQYQRADGWSSVHFVRPAHGLVALHGADVVPVQALGLTAGRETHGHRFEAAVDPIVLPDADSYAELLKTQGAVIASFEARRAEIVRQLQAAAAKEGLTPVDDAALLDEVTALVERPNVLLCRFEPEFLGVPQECLILTMKANQKYFPLLDAAGRLTEKFLVVSNITPADAGRIVEGNERVVRPRLADAKFFFDQDRKRTLESRVPGLDKVVYHGKLGTQGERTQRVRMIARWVAERIGCDVELSDRAALLAKADLLTDMVGEFPELQGIMGRYYAIHDGEALEVARAIGAQYLNKREDWDGATNLVGEALLIADRAETLVGIWGIGLRPTGEKDPFALRRHALTIISSFQIVTAFSSATRGKLSLRGLLEVSASAFGSIAIQPSTIDEVETFVYERYFNQLASLFDVRAVDAVISQRPPLSEISGRVIAVRDFQLLPESASLAAANKRVGNILKKVEGAVEARVDPALLHETAEAALHRALNASRPSADAAFESGDYTASLRALASLKEPVDAFFETVMVNSEDRALRANRLGLLATLHAAMNRVADLSKLAS